MLVSSSPLTRQSPSPDQEFQDIERQLADRVDVYPCKGMEYVEFTRQLAEFAPDVLHMAMHGTTNGLLFQKYNFHHEVPYTDLVEDICRVTSLRAVVMDICYSSSSSGSSVSPSFARQLVESGIPSAIGMSSTITLPASLEFSNRLYSELGLGKSILEAYDRAITTLRQQPDISKLLWSVPIMYQYTNVYPFPNIKHHADTLDRIAYLPVRQLRETSERIDEFMLNYDAFAADNTWTLDEWQTETIPIWLIMPSLKESIEDLAHLPHSHKRDEMKWIFQLNDYREKTLDLISDFEETLANITYGKRIKPEQINHLSNVGRKLIKSLEGINSLILQVISN